MIILIYLFVFFAVLAVTNILLSKTIPAIADKYNDWQMKRVGKVADKLEDSFIFLEKKKMVYVSISPLIFAVLGFLLVRHPLSLVFGFLLGLALPGVLTKILKQMRLKKIHSQLVDSLMILTSSLKGGLSFIQSLEVLREEIPTPISQEIDLVLKENKLGISLEESLRKLRKRVPLEEVNLLVSSVLVARETGGEITKVFARLTETIRDNVKLKEKVATLTLQGRLQGLIMTFLPIVFTIFIYKQNPEHFTIMWETQLGRTLIGVAVVAQIVGMILIKRISTIRI